MHSAVGVLPGLTEILQSSMGVGACVLTRHRRLLSWCFAVSILSSTASTSTGQQNGSLLSLGIHSDVVGAFSQGFSSWLLPLMFTCWLVFAAVPGAAAGAGVSR